jgi:uncharacterized cupredoxin-like copper-binding protein
MGLIVTMLLAVSLVVAACGSSSTPESASSPSDESESANETINVVMHDIYYGDTNDNQANPPVWTVTSDAQVTINLDNQGALRHNWAVVKPGVELPATFDMEANADLLLYDTGILDGGTQSTTTFLAPEPGEYLVICTVPGHYPLMQGKLIVN